jgi:hypothetical protein
MSLPGYTHTFVLTWTDGTQTITWNVPVNADSQRYVDQTIAPNVSNVPYSVMMNVASIKGFFGVATGTVTLTFIAANTANNTTITLTGGIPQEFISTSSVSVAASPLFIPHDIVGISFTNGNSATSDVKLRFLLDSSVNAINA